MRNSATMTQIRSKQPVQRALLSGAGNYSHGYFNPNIYIYPMLLYFTNFPEVRIRDIYLSLGVLDSSKGAEINSLLP